jgi:hypothetical protein
MINPVRMMELQTGFLTGLVLHRYTVVSVVIFMRGDDKPFPTKRADTDSKDKITEMAVQKMLKGEQLKTRKPQVCRDEKCNNMSTRRTGFCGVHEKKYKQLIEASLMKCDNCMASGDCPHADNDLGFCVFEISNDPKLLKEKDNVIKKMREILNTEEKIVGRFKRALASADPASMMSLAKEFRFHSQQYFSHLNEYVRMMGWNKEKQAHELEKQKLRIFDKIFTTKTRRQGMKDEIPTVQHIHLTADDISGESQGLDLGEFEREIVDDTLDGDVKVLEREKEKLKIKKLQSGQ